MEKSEWRLLEFNAETQDVDIRFWERNARYLASMYTGEKIESIDDKGT